MGYFVGHESESVYLVWHPEKNTVKRVDQARVISGHGLTDPHSSSSRSARLADGHEPSLEEDNVREKSIDDALISIATGSNSDSNSSADNGPPVRSRFFANIAKGVKPRILPEEWIAVDLLKEVDAASIQKLLDAVFNRKIGVAKISERRKALRDPQRILEIAGFNDQTLRDTVEAKLANAQEKLGLVLKKKYAREYGTGRHSSLSLDQHIFFHLLHHTNTNAKSKYAAFAELFPDTRLPKNAATIEGKLFRLPLEELVAKWPGFDDNARRITMQKRIEATTEMSKPPSVTSYSLRHIDQAAKCTYCKPRGYACSGEKTGTYPCDRCKAISKPYRIKLSDQESITYYGEDAKLPNTIAEVSDVVPPCCFECNLYARTYTGGDADGDQEWPCGRQTVMCRKPNPGGGIRAYSLVKGRSPSESSRIRPKLDDGDGALDDYESDSDDEAGQHADTKDDGVRGPANFTMTEEERLTAREKLRNLKLPEAFHGASMDDEYDSLILNDT
ncbi:hypothetical protein B0A54_05234 [Friedmanniomyces endolithicus]|uniref:Uncharacterized protein n=1 Tax=Friedmanniomyces endolithicus TaxID=329885 RepID=A0A4V5N8P7_9PEZI|nr:hypothetical protein B0A54_05234 [Friedmanniomyces endolithicus]